MAKKMLEQIPSDWKAAKCAAAKQQVFDTLPSRIEFKHQNLHLTLEIAVLANPMLSAGHNSSPKNDEV